MDLENGLNELIEENRVADPEQLKRMRTDARKFKNFNKLLTPMAKYYSSEMSMRVSNNAMAVLGGSGYMKDYPVERHLRDSRITTIYEGTSQLQVVAAVSGVTSGAVNDVIKEILGDRVWPHELETLVAKIKEGQALLTEAAAFVKAQTSGNAYRDLYARKLVDIGINLVVAALFCDHAMANPKKLVVAKRWVTERLPQIKMLKEQICSGATFTLDEFDTLAPLAVSAD